MLDPDHRPFARAPAPGPDSLQVAVWNAGMATDTAFYSTYERSVARAARNICSLLEKSHVVGINEMHRAHWPSITNALERIDETVRFLGLETQGDAVAWHR